MIIAKTDERDVLFLIRALDNFDKNDAVKDGLRAAASTFIVKGKANLGARLIGGRGRKGNLMASFVARVKKRKLGALAGFKPAKEKGDVGGNHAHLVDRGTGKRYTKKHAPPRYRGIMPANKFWTDANASEWPKAMEALKEGIQLSIDKINARR